VTSEQPDEVRAGAPALPSTEGDVDAPGLGIPGLEGLLAQAQQVQAQLLAAQAAAEEQVFRGQAGGGVVAVELTGGLDVRAVRISPDVVDPADVEMLEDLVLAALRDAVAQLSDARQASMGELGLGGGLGGLLGG
jgi:hypothetical protein